MDNLEATLGQSISKGISFLARQQLSNGEFRCYFSNNDDLLIYNTPTVGWCVEDSAVFPTALIANSLLYLAGDASVNDILNKATQFLLGQKKNGSVWNHFTKGHNLYQMCPFDLDDTACVSVFLKARGINFPSNLGVIESNLNKNKLFYTWITPRLKLNYNKQFWRIAMHEWKNPIKSFFFWIKMECSRGDIDAVVNANVLYYLGENEKTEAVIKYLSDIILNNQEADCDKWYRNVLTVYYFISRNYYAGVTALKPAGDIIVERVLSMLKPNGCIGESALDTALGACTLLNLKYTGPEMELAIKYLLNEQTENGNWKKRAYYYGGPKKLVNWGAEELTTAVCLEALARYKEEITT